MCFKSILEDCIETIPREYHRTRECADLEGTHRENIKSNCWTCAGHPNPTVHPLAITINSSYLPLQLLCSSTPVILLFLVKAMDESHLKVKVLILMASKLPFVCFFFFSYYRHYIAVIIAKRKGVWNVHQHKHIHIFRGRITNELNNSQYFVFLNIMWNIMNILLCILSIQIFSEVMVTESYNGLQWLYYIGKSKRKSG